MGSDRTGLNERHVEEWLGLAPEHAGKRVPGDVRILTFEALDLEDFRDVAGDAPADREFETGTTESLRMPVTLGLSLIDVQCKVFQKAAQVYNTCFMI